MCEIVNLMIDGDLVVVKCVDIVVVVGVGAAAIPSRGLEPQYNSTC